MTSSSISLWGLLQGGPNGVGGKRKWLRLLQGHQDDATYWATGYNALFTYEHTPADVVFMFRAIVNQNVRSDLALCPVMRERRVRRAVERGFGMPLAQHLLCHPHLLRVDLYPGWVVAVQFTEDNFDVYDTAALRLVAQHLDVLETQFVNELLLCRQIVESQFSRNLQMLWAFLKACSRFRREGGRNVFSFFLVLDPLFL